MRIPTPVLSAAAVILASSSLAVLFSDSRWVWPSLGAVVVAVLMGTLARALPLPRALRALAGIGLSIGGFLCYATAVLVPATAIARIIPGTGTPGALRAMSDQASSDIHDLLAPIPAEPGVVLFAVAGCYATAACADLLVSGLRRPALAGFPLFVLFAVPAALARDGAGWFAFVATSTGYLILLHADGRAALWRWGHPVRAAQQPAAGGRLSRARANRWLPAATGTGRRIGVLSIAGALVLPALIPIGGSTWLASARSRVGHTVTVPPLVDIATRLHDRNPTTVLEVETTHPQYLRMTALDLFSGNQFGYLKQDVGTPASLRDDLATTTYRGNTTLTSGNITASSALHERFLPLPYETTSLQVGVGWRYAPATSTVFSTTADTSALSWAFNAQTPAPSPAELIASGPPGGGREVGVDLMLPTNLDPRIGQLARQLGAAGDTAYAKAVAIQQYLRGSTFTYDLNGAPTGANALSEFLFVSHTGFCQQFASAMAVLARAVGIPARVAIGFTAGQLSAGDSTYTVTTADAHAWPELYFPGVGWVPFEPTPRGDGQAVTPDYSVPVGGSTAPGTSAQAGTDPGTDAIPGKVRTPTTSRGAVPAATQPASPAPASAQSWWWTGPAAAVAVLLLLLVPISGRSRLRRRRQQRGLAGDPTAKWQELLDTAQDLGLEPPPTQSPRRAGQLLAGRLSDPAGAAVERLARAEERRRYAPPDGTPDLAAAGWADVAAASVGLRQSVPWHTRLRALLLPRSWFRRHGTRVKRLVGSLRRPVDTPGRASGQKPGHAAG